MTKPPNAEPRRFWGPSVDADVQDELRHHLDACAADLVSLGHSPEDARREAERRFGDVATVETWLRSHDHHRLRRMARVEHMETLLQDIRYGIRKLWQQPAFTLSVVGVFALGIGAATTMFTAVDAALLRPLPFQRDDRLVASVRIQLPFALSESTTSATIEDARELDVFEEVSAYAPGALNLGAGDAPARINIGAITPELFETLGVTPAAGRAFTAEEGQPDGPDVAILSHGIWRRYFAGDRGVLDQNVILNGKPYRIVGVMPAGFGFPRDAAVWIPLHLPWGFADMEPFRQYMPSTVVARLAPGVTLDQARTQVLTVFQRKANPDRPFTLSASDVLTPLREFLVGTTRTALLVLMGATALVLLVACANVTNLLLSRASARRPEIALRAALGASRPRILRQLLVESVLLALAGGAVGVLIAALAVNALGTIMPAHLAGLAPAQLDLRVLGFSLAVAITTGLVFGVWPAFGATRTDAAEVIKSGGAGTTGARAGARVRRAFVIAELAISLMLAVGAGLMLRSLQTLFDNDPGMVAEQLATLELSFNRATYPQGEARWRFMENVLERVERIPGVEAAAFVNELPLRGANSVSVSVRPEGAPAPEDVEDIVFALLQSVSPEYFRAMGIPVLTGRMPRAKPDTLAAEEMAISQKLARRLFAGEDPIGRRVVFGARASKTVVGVVGDLRGRTLEDTLGSQMYMPLQESPGTNVALVARGTLPEHVLAGRLQEAVIAEDPQQAVYNVRPMTDVIARALTPKRVNALLITTFSLVALLLAAVGVYGVIAYGVSRRTREIGIRIALGARGEDVMRLVMREGVLLGIAGVALGLAGAWALRRLIEGMLYGIQPEDPITFVLAAVVLMATAAFATLIPSRRATRVDPVRAIRAE
jgi:predicted permease